MRPKKIAFYLCSLWMLSSFSLPPADTQQVEQMLSQLRQFEPHWHQNIEESDEQGFPKKMVLYEQIEEGPVQPLKEKTFYAEQKRPKSEVDLITVEKDSPGALLWKSTTVPHGTALYLYPNGEIEKIAHYAYGLLEGKVYYFYPEGNPKAESSFKKGKREGRAVVYYPDGKIQEESYFQEDKLHGDVIQYYPSGKKQSFVHYEQGLPHEDAFEWYENGNLASSRHYEKGMLHAMGGNSAFVAYDENSAICQVQDFVRGQREGVHIKYEKGKVVYKVLYKEGKKEGKEIFWDTQGKVRGEGLYIEGKPVHRHWREYPNGNKMYEAFYSAEGILQKPIEEWSEDKVLVKRYFPVEEGKYEGLYEEFYPSGKPKICYQYTKGELDGEQKEFYPKGNIKFSVFYLQGKVDGEQKNWYENGTIQSILHFRLGEKEGESLFFFENGQLQHKEFYKNNKLDGKVEMFFENGALRGEGFFKEGLQEGLFKEWDQEGRVLFEARYQSGLLHGWQKEWDTKGYLIREVEYREGKKEGVEKTYWPMNGELQTAFSYKEGVLDGKSVFYYENGAIGFEKTFSAGKPVGEHRFFHPPTSPEEKKGIISQLAQFDAEGKLTGELKIFHSTGILKELQQYVGGQLEGVRTAFDAQGKLLEEYHFEKGRLTGSIYRVLPDGREEVSNYYKDAKHGPFTLYFSSTESGGNKTKALEAYFEHNLLEGEVSEFDPQGRKTSSIFFVHGKKEGLAKWFDPKGRVIREMEYKNDVPHGHYVEYYPSGKIAKEAFYEKGEKSGPETLFFSDGAIASKAFYKEGKKEGVFEEWNSLHNLICQAEYKEDKREGKFNKYYEDGTPYIEQFYQNDQLHGEKKVYKKDGTILTTYWKEGHQLGENRR